jgi:hypothetical protein
MRDAIDILCKLAIIGVIAIIGVSGYGLFKLITWLM